MFYINKCVYDLFATSSAPFRRFARIGPPTSSLTQSNTAAAAAALLTLLTLTLTLLMLLGSEHLLRDGREHLFHIDVVFGRGLKQPDAHLRGELSSVVRQHDFSFRVIVLIAHEDAVDDVVAVVVNFVEPPFDIGERLSVRHVVHDDDSVSASVISGSDGAESLLSGRVPDLQFNPFAVNGHRADFKVHSDGGDVVAAKRVIGESDQQRTLANSGIADDEQLEQVVVVLVGRRRPQRHLSRLE